MLVSTVAYKHPQVSKIAISHLILGFRRSVGRHDPKRLIYERLSGNLARASSFTSVMIVDSVAVLV